MGASCDGHTPLYVHERVSLKLALKSGQQIGVSTSRSDNERHATFRELVNGLYEQEKPCFVIMPMKCTDKTNKDVETTLLRALMPPLDTSTVGAHGDLYAVWASKAMVDKFREQLANKFREQLVEGSW